MELFVNFRDACRCNVDISFEKVNRMISIKFQSATNKKRYRIDIANVYSDVTDKNIIFHKMMMIRMADDYVLFKRYDEALKKLSINNKFDRIMCLILPSGRIKVNG